MTELTNIGVAAVILLLLLDRLPTFVSRIRGPVVHTNGKAVEISVAAWELKFATMFKDSREQLFDKLDDHHDAEMREFERILKALGSGVICQSSP